CPPRLPGRDRWPLRARHRGLRALLLWRYRQGDCLWRGCRRPWRAPGRGGGGWRPELVLAFQRGTPEAATWHRGRAAAADLRAAESAALRSDSGPAGPRESGGWPAALHGEVRLHRGQGLPEGRYRGSLESRK